MITLLEGPYSDSPTEYISIRGFAQQIPCRKPTMYIKIISDEELKCGIPFDHVFNNILYIGICPVQLEQIHSNHCFYYQYICIIDTIEKAGKLFTLPDEIF